MFQRARRRRRKEGGRAVFQRAFSDETYSRAVRAKKSYPRKDAAGRLQNESSCLPFILTSMGGLCEEGHEFLRLCKKRNKGATLHLLDVLVTQHAKWTAKRIRRGLFGQSLVDFSTESWSSIQLQESAKGDASEQKRTLPKKAPRILRSFASSRVVGGKKRISQSFVPGMSQYSDDLDVVQDAGTAKHTSSLSFSTSAANQMKVPQEFDIFSEASGSEESVNNLE